MPQLRRPSMVPKWLHTWPMVTRALLGLVALVQTSPPSYILHSHQTPSSPLPPQIPTLPHAPFYLDDGYLCTCFSVGLGYKCLGSQDLQFQFSAIKCKSKSMKTNSIPDMVQVLRTERWTRHGPHPQGSHSPGKDTTCIISLIWGTTCNCRNTFEMEWLHRWGTVPPCAGLAVHRWFPKGQESAKQHSGSAAWSIQAILERWVFL